MGEHARYSPSSADRWMNCPGYLSLLDQTVEQFGEEKSSPAAKEGTRAHEIAARLLLSRNPTRALVKADDIELETSTAVGVYIDIVEEYLDKLIGPAIYVEQLLRAKEFHDQLYGTVDCLILHRDGIVIIDYKHGSGVRVDPDSWQLKVYGYIAAAQSATQIKKPIELVVVQPRYHEAGLPHVRSQAYSPEEFEPIAKEIERAMTRADTTCIEGDHCRFCYAKPLCPRKGEMIMEALDDKEKIKFILENKKELYDIIRRAEGLAISGLENGTLDPEALGYGLAPRRGNRAWKHEKGDAALAALLRRQGVDKEAVWTKKLISPAKAEKYITDKKWLTKYVEREDKGVALVPLSKADPSLCGTVINELGQYKGSLTVEGAPAESKIETQQTKLFDEEEF